MVKMFEKRYAIPIHYVNLSIQLLLRTPFNSIERKYKNILYQIILNEFYENEKIMTN